MFFKPVQGPCVTLKGAVRALTDTLRNWHDQIWQKSRTGDVFGSTGAHMGPLRSPHGLFTGCLRSLNPCGARKLIMHALYLYGPRTERYNSYGAALVPRGSREWMYGFCSKQPVRGSGVWCDWGISEHRTRTAWCPTRYGDWPGRLGELQQQGEEQQTCHWSTTPEDKMKEGHYNVTFTLRRPKSTATPLFVQQLVQVNKSHQSSALLVLCGGDWWFPSQRVNRRVFPCHVVIKQWP